MYNTSPEIGGIKALSRAFIRGYKCDVHHIVPGCVM
jgi:hypothetical protein